MTTSVASALDWWARTKGDQAVLVFGDERISHRELRNWSGRVAARLARADGVAEGDRVAVLGGNTPQWPAAAFGVIKAGGVLVPLNPRLVAPELVKLVRDAGVSVVVAEEAHEPVLAQVRALGAEFSVVPMGEIAALRPGGDEAFRVDRRPAEPVAILYTSGSTGLSKGVICTNRTLLDIVFEASLVEEGLRPGARSLLLLPLCFTPGLVWGLVMTTVLGGTLVVEPELNPERAVALLDRHQIQVLFGVPLIYEVMARAPSFPAADLSHLRTAVVGGAAVSVPLLRAWGDKGVKLRQIYGMTEAGGIATATWPAEAEEHPDSCGSGSVFTDVIVAGPDGRERTPGEAGEILVRGPGVTPGYWNDPDATARALAGGWLHSGDLGRRDADGRLAFVDRIKDLIISGGINISPIEIEAVLAAIPGVAEATVISAADEKFGETPAAILYVTEDIDAAKIVAVCAEQLADYKVPRYVVLRREPLPRLPSGKISKTAIRAEYPDVPARYPRVR